jgi:hypothetical protein
VTGFFVPEKSLDGSCRPLPHFKAWCLSSAGMHCLRGDGANLAGPEQALLLSATVFMSSGVFRGGLLVQPVSGRHQTGIAVVFNQ